MELFRDRFLPSTKDAIGPLNDLYVYIDGRFLRQDKARISVWEHGLMYGDSVFEGIRAYGGKVFRLNEHLGRLIESAKSVGIQVPLSIDELTQVVLATFGINRLEEGHMRLTVTRGIGSVGLNPRNAKFSSVIAMAYPFPPSLGKKPIGLITSSIRRKRTDSVDAKIKVSNYMDNILAKLQANAAGFDDALMLDFNGYVAEATAMNILVLRKGMWLTPTSVACLEGITRRIAIDILAQLEYPTQECNLTLHDVYVAEEVFLTGTGGEIVPVESVDGRMIGKIAPGPITLKVISKFRAATEEGVPIVKFTDISE
jgi:branched-chain amino acid aminotransferase